MQVRHRPTQEILIRRRGLVFVEASGGAIDEDLGRAAALQFAGLGYVPSTRLQQRLGQIPTDQLAPFQSWICDVLRQHLGADQWHRPLFRNFPEDIPTDTRELWWRKVLCHFLQAHRQPCLFCRQTGTTHVLSPCQHVICDRCFDGSNYSACPVCEHHVDTESPFFQPSSRDRQAIPDERVVFQLLDLAEDLDARARELLVSFCERTQPLSPVDREDLKALLEDYRTESLEWIPDEIPVKETAAIVLGTLFRVCDPDAVMSVARRYLKTATDVLRFLASYSGADPSLQRETIFKPRTISVEVHPWWARIARALGAKPPEREEVPVMVPVRIRRFKVARMTRPFRRAVLSILDSLDGESLVEDMIRHRSYWVWIGEFLHPHEYHKRFPQVAQAFRIVRRRGPDGTPAPRFQTYHGRLDQAARNRDAARFAAILRERPGEQARRLDHALRLAAGDPRTVQALVESFGRSTSTLSTPVLLTLRNTLPTRTRRAAIRIYWPKGTQAKGVSAPDDRPVLSEEVVRVTVDAIESELLRRLAEQPRFETFVVDAALGDIMVPFNERTTSPAAVNLPRGSRIDVPPETFARLFLHWCEPEIAGRTTDLDLSVGLYDARWNYVGVCSYYQLKFPERNRAFATSSGDLRSAPFPDGATEFIDLHCDRARERGVRFAVMVVNSYSGLPFSRLDRSFAGLMLRRDERGKHFDPRTVKLRFSLRGESGIYLPFVFDIAEHRLHWLDTYSKGQLLFNNVENANAAIMKLCPEMITYFGSGVRMNMFELALLHAASRAEQVFVRGDETLCFERQAGEESAAFAARLRSGRGGRCDRDLPSSHGPPLFAVLHQGDLDLPAGSTCYALFKERSQTTLEASGLIV